MRLGRFALFAVLFSSSPGFILGQALQGKVSAIHLSEQSEYLTDPNGQHGVTVHRKRQIYTVETADRVYLLKGSRKPELELGTQITFRIQNRVAFVWIGKKEKKFSVVGEELKKHE